MTVKSEELFNTCLEQVLAGESLENCLRDYPEHAAELRPILETALGVVSSSSAIKSRPEVKIHSQWQVREALLLRKLQKSRKFAWQPQWALATVAVLLVIIVSGVSIVGVASASQPDSIFYPAKLITEKARLALTFSEEAKTAYRIELAETRVNEVAYLATSGDTNRIDSVVRTLEINLTGMALPATATAPPEVSKDTTLTGPDSGTPAPSTQPGLAPPYPVPAPRAPAPTFAPPVSDTKHDLAVSEQRSLAALQQALQNAPPAARPALEKAIARIIQAYEEAKKKSTPASPNRSGR